MLQDGTYLFLAFFLLEEHRTLSPVSFIITLKFLILKLKDGE